MGISLPNFLILFKVYNQFVSRPSAVSSDSIFALLVERSLVFSFLLSRKKKLTLSERLSTVRCKTDIKCGWRRSALPKAAEVVPFSMRYILLSLKIDILRAPWLRSSIGMIEARRAHSLFQLQWKEHPKQRGLSENFSVPCTVVTVMFFPSSMCPPQLMQLHLLSVLPPFGTLKTRTARSTTPNSPEIDTYWAENGGGRCPIEPPIVSNCLHSCRQSEGKW